MNAQQKKSLGIVKDDVYIIYPVYFAVQKFKNRIITIITVRLIYVPEANQLIARAASATAADQKSAFEVYKNLYKEISFYDLRLEYNFVLTFFFN